MADKRIGELNEAPALYDDTLFAVEQQGEARRLTGKQIRSVAGGGGFIEMVKSIPAPAERADNHLYGLILERY